MTVDFKNLDIMTNALNLDTGSRPNLSVNPFKCVSVFANSNVKTLKLLNLDTSNINSLMSMFSGCSTINKIDISDIEFVHDITNMSHIFRNCSELVDLRLGRIKTSKVTSMARAFDECDCLEALDISSIDTSSVTDMSSMFRFCGVNELDLSNFDTYNVTDMDSMFAGCSASSLDLRSFNTRKVKSMKSMFTWCDSLKKLDLSSFIIQQDTITSMMFNCCKELDILILPVDPYSRMRIEQEMNSAGIECCTQ